MEGGVGYLPGHQSGHLGAQNGRFWTLFPAPIWAPMPDQKRLCKSPKTPKIWGGRSSWGQSGDPWPGEDGGGSGGLEGRVLGQGGSRRDLEKGGKNTKKMRKIVKWKFSPGKVGRRWNDEEAQGTEHTRLQPWWASDKQDTNKPTQINHK